MELMEIVDGFGAIDTGNARCPSTKVMEEDVEDEGEGLLHNRNMLLPTKFHVTLICFNWCSPISLSETL